MHLIKVTNSHGDELDIEFFPGDTLMQTLVGAGVSDVLALCGGVCSCATCHVYLDSGITSAIPSADGEEIDLLEMLEARRENSRLSCQVRLTEDCDGKRVIVAEQST
jgi:ferredoxin, 2Fe-2S